MARIQSGLITELRKTGLEVVEVPGCWGRDNGNDAFAPRGLIIHATAGSAGALDANELRVILYGSNTAPPPISQFMLGRTGIVYFVADGRCNHVRNGFANTHFAGVGNGNLIGIEGCNDNKGESWSRSYAAYVTLAAVIARWYGWPVADIRGHKEHQPGDKSDPTFNMGTFRAGVATRINELAAGPVPAPTQEDDMALPLVFHNVEAGVVTYALVYGPGQVTYVKASDGDNDSGEYEFVSKMVKLTGQINTSNVNGSENLSAPAWEALQDSHGTVPA